MLAPSIQQHIFGTVDVNSKTTLATMEKVVPGFKQINWQKATNRPLMKIVGKIETPFLLMNPSFPSVYIEEFFPLIKDTGPAFKAFAKSGSEQVHRELVVNKMYLEDEIDWGLVESASEIIPMDETTRLYVLSLGSSMITGYLEQNPDKYYKYPKDIGDRIIRTLLFEENFFGDPEDDDDRQEHARKLIDLERIEKKIMSDYRLRFETSSVQGLANSQIPAIRAEVACIKGIDPGVVMKLASDKSDFVKRKLATCTANCTALKKIKDDKKTGKMAREKAESQFDKLCK